MRHYQIGILFILFTITNTINGQDLDRKISFPDIPGYKTLICDFHTHSVFSDGSVWPNIRVDEAVRDGLDALAITEHIEYQPHKEDIENVDRNRAYILAEKYARPHDLLVIPGAEITRDLPPGHANALFISDANKLNVKDPMDAYAAARKQGAFIFWNHPDWIGQDKDGIAKITDVHKKLIAEDLLHGIEVVNDLTYSKSALDISDEYGLSAIGTSDIHGLVDWQFMIPEGGHRPVSLVFATERSMEGIKEALFDKRVVAWFNDLLLGPLDLLQSLISSSIHMKNKGFIGSSNELEIEISNTSDAKMMLANMSDYEFHNQPDILVLEPQSTIKLNLITKTGTGDLILSVISALAANEQHPKIVFPLDD